jgi:hypothetical protein
MLQLCGGNGRDYEIKCNACGWRGMESDLGQ